MVGGEGSRVVTVAQPAWINAENSSRYRELMTNFHCVVKALMFYIMEPSTLFPMPERTVSLTHAIKNFLTRAPIGGGA